MSAGGPAEPKLPAVMLAGVGLVFICPDCGRHLQAVRVEPAPWRTEQRLARPKA
jgi:hypothetical protein